MNTQLVLRIETIRNPFVQIMLKDSYNDANGSGLDYTTDWTLAVAERLRDFSGAWTFRVVFKSLSVLSGKSDPMYVPNEADNPGGFSKASANSDGGQY